MFKSLSIINGKQPFSVSEKVTCLNPEIVDWSDVVKMTCNSAHCDQSGFMHAECFDKYEQIILHFLSKQGRGRTWNDKQVSCYPVTNNESVQKDSVRTLIMQSWILTQQLKFLKLLIN